MLDLDLRHVLVGIYLLLLGGGTYLTYVQQERTIARLEKKIQTHDTPSSSLTGLEERQNSLEDRVHTLKSERRNRYKRMPEQVSSPDVLQYLTNVAGGGFHTFNLTTVGRRSEDGYQVFTVKADGRAFFSRLYHFIWTVENHRPFYRIENLTLSLLDERTTDRTTGRQQMKVLVSFQMDVSAIFGGSGEDLGGASEAGDRNREELPVARTDPHPPVPSTVLPPSHAGVNPFYPLIFDQIPPNEHGRLNVEQAKFLSIIDGRAVFKSDDGLARVGEGDRVYLGRIIEIDPKAGRVVARLNKGGIVGTVERTLNGSGSPFGRQEPR